MKNIKYLIILFFIVLISMTSCNEDFFGKEAARYGL